jgi:branched-chain amino acid transport system permease protein
VKLVMQGFRRLDSKRIKVALREIGPGLVFALVVAAALPAVASVYWIKTLTSAAIMTLVSLSVGLLYAQLGMVSLCQYALAGLGGWVALRVTFAYGLPFEASVLAGGIVASAFGVVVGLPALRMRGLYLALITLMIAGAFQNVISATGFPDGGSGFLGRITTGHRMFMVRPALAFSDAAYLRYVIAAVAVGFLIVRWHRRSRAGRAWAQIRRSEACALSAGVNVVAFKVWAFALAGFLAGVGGGLIAGSIGQMDGRAFSASDSIMLFVLTIIAGPFHWLGPMIAGLMFRAVPAIFTDWSINGNIATMIFGAGLVHALITTPEGVSSQLRGLGKMIVARAMRSRGGATP